MPDGVVQWLDPASGQASVVRGGRAYAASLADLDPSARRPGARVRFDVRRDGDGGERAVEVTLRPASRASRHRRRVGTLVGARRPDARGATSFERSHPEQHRALTSNPLEVGRALVECMQSHDVDGALALYRSDAVLHGPGGDLVGRSNIGSHLGSSAVLGIGRDPEIRGDAGIVVIRWEDEEIELRCRIEHAEIVEQWVGQPAPRGRNLDIQSAEGLVPVEFVTSGRVADADVEYVIERIEPSIRRLGAPVLHIRLKLSRAPDPARSKPVLAEVVVDVNGELIRAHVAAGDTRDAADLLQRRLNDQIEQRAEHREALRARSGIPEPGQWRHGDLPTARPEYFDRPVEERELVRHKAFAVEELTPDEAAFDMEQLDYDFHLFRDLATGEDALLERLADGDLRLTRLHSTAVDPGPSAVALAIATTTPPELTVDEAGQRLNAGGERFFFFAHAATGRGNVIYRRYDGHLGLLTLEEQEGGSAS